MNTQEWFKNKLESFKEDFEFRFETLILEITEKISRRMKQKKINRTNLADLLEVSRPAVTKILDGNSNFTLRKLLSLADALELDLEIDFKEKDMVDRVIPLHKPYFHDLEAYEREQGYPLNTVASSSTETVFGSDASASITAPPPYRITGKNPLAKVVNA
jgi:transcriptional regulator with XRE-family HTH domain